MFSPDLENYLEQNPGPHPSRRSNQNWLAGGAFTVVHLPSKPHLLRHPGKR